MAIVAPVDGDLVDPDWASQITAAVNTLLTDMATAKQATSKLLNAPTTWSNPTLQNITLGNGTVLAWYMHIGYLCKYSIKFVMGTGSSISGGMGFTLPVPADPSYYANSQDIIGYGSLFDLGVKDYDISVRYTTGDIASLVSPGTNGLHAAVTSTAPYSTVGTGDGWSVWGEYRTLNAAT